MHAQSSGGPTLTGDSVGLATMAAPVYAGSDEYRTRVLLLFEFRWSNGIFLSAAEGLGYQAAAGRVLSGAQVTADLGRRERDAEDRRGMGDVETRPELGVSVRLPIGERARVSSSLRYGSGNDRNGLVLKLSAMQALPIPEAWTAHLGVGATWANAHHQQAYFGVTPAQSVATGLAAFEPGSGLKEVGLVDGLGYRAGAGHALNFGITVASLQGDARRSPIVRRRMAPVALLTWADSL
jgi:outer membrane protein